jgi:hypothetical protein
MSVHAGTCPPEGVSASIANGFESGSVSVIAARLPVRITLYFGFQRIGKHLPCHRQFGL